MIIFVDAGPLSHFAQAGLLPLLERLLSGYPNKHYPPEVQSELQAGAIGPTPSNNQVFSCEWITVHDQDIAGLGREIIAIQDDIGGDPSRNLGEAACIARALRIPGSVYLDDGDGRDTAETYGLPTVTTLDLLQEAVKVKVITKEDAKAAVTSLLLTSYRLPGYSLHAFD